MALRDSSQLDLPLGGVPHRILVVEENRSEAEALKRGLEQRGFSVTIAKDGGQAHSSFAMHKPDFVFLALLLSGESGFEVCERMKRTEPSIPVVILTIVDLPEARTLADRVGADDYLVKPCAAEVLEERIKVVGQAVWERTHLDQPRETGRVRFQCRCGKRFKVSTSHRGKSMTCPSCGEPLIVPRHD